MPKKETCVLSHRWLLLAVLGAAFHGEAVAAEPRTANLHMATSGLECCTVVELRQYTLKPGRRETFISLFDGTFADPLDATGMTVVGQFRDLDRQDRFVWIRGFQDMPSRAVELAAFYDSALWHGFRDEANASIDDSDNVLLLEQADPSLRFHHIPARAQVGGRVDPGGLVVITLYYSKPDTMTALSQIMDESVRERFSAAGAKSVAIYQTSQQENNFPRLPIRVGEHILVWVASFRNEAAYVAFNARISGDKQWKEDLWPSVRGLLTKDPEVLRLKPTDRSRFRGL